MQPRFSEADVVIVGAGFAGMYALRTFRDTMGLEVRAFERGNDVGGTWYWNAYPGARCDVESMFYSYSFDEQLEQDWRWSERYPPQPEILAYAQHVADRFDLRRSISFETSVIGAEFDEYSERWLVSTDSGEIVAARFLVTAAGCLSAGRVPDIEGLESFTGDLLHTGTWPQAGYDLVGKRVAVIGTGSSGVQAIPELAKVAGHLTVFQRTPHFVIPAGNRALIDAEIDEIKADYRKWRAVCRINASGTPLEAPLGGVFEFESDAVQAEFERRWGVGGTNLMTSFTDTGIDLDANAVLADFIRSRIAQIVDDESTAQSLTPRGYPVGAKRIALGSDYYATYNRPNVSLVDVRENVIERMTEHGIVAGGVEHEFDVIVFATGYDAMTGAITGMNIVGTDGRTIAEHWEAGPRTYLGVACVDFPNLFMLTGPGSPSVLTNVIVSIEQHVEWVADLIEYALTEGISRIEAQLPDQDAWVEQVNAIASKTMYMKASSWYLGANIPGKARVFMPYAGGIKRYSDTCDAVAAEGYRGFTLTRTAEPVRNLTAVAN